MTAANISGIRASVAATSDGFAIGSQPALVTRREFLFYIWGASLALATAEGVGALMWFALPRFRPGEFGGIFSLSLDSLPQASPDAKPVLYAAGKFWLSNTEEGFRAMSQVCTHLGCLFQWQEYGTKTHPFPHFVCPCHDSQFDNKGVYVDGPAPRSLDQFAVTVTYADGTTAMTSGPGAAVSVVQAQSIAVNTGKKIIGKAHG